MRKKDLINKLKQIKEQGFVKSFRKGSTGVGYTFEKLLGIQENNIPVPDIGGRLEIKATRKDSNSLLTLFTFNKGIWQIKQKDLIEQYGYEDEKGRKALKKTLTFSSSDPTFKLSIDEGNQSLILYDKKQNEILAIWNLYVIVGKFSTKLDKVLYVLADRKFDEYKTEYFHYNEIYILSEPNINNFIAAFKDSEIAIDLRMHLKDNKQSVRNRGTAFRIYEKSIMKLFNKIERIL
ncbi:MvaI/BcnI family restriction endonuclease [Thermodesulfovibrio hydrogeniphilus]